MFADSPDPDRSGKTSEKSIALILQLQPSRSNFPKTEQKGWTTNSNTNEKKVRFNIPCITNDY